MKGQTILLTSNSTGDYAVQACLKSYGLAKCDVTIKNMGQAEIISAMSSSNAELARPVGAQHLHARGEGRRQGAVLAARKAASSCPAR